MLHAKDYMYSYIYIKTTQNISYKLAATTVCGWGSDVVLPLYKISLAYYKH